MTTRLRTHIINLLILLVMTAVSMQASAAEGTVLTVNVDDASQVELKIGSSKYFSSSSNRTIQLVDGENTIICQADDKYVLVSSTSLWTPLHKVTFNGHNLACDEEWVYGAIIPATGGIMDIIAREPESEMATFKAYIDDPANVKYFTRYPANDDKSVNAGENVYTFKDGDYFQAICFVEAKSCTLDGVVVDPTMTNGSYIYTFTPKGGSEFILKFNDDGNTHGKSTFTLHIDDTSKLSYFTQEGMPEIELLGTLIDGDNEIEFVGGTQFSIWPAYGHTPAEITLDGVEIAKHASANAYYFTPSDGSTVNVLFNAGPAADEYTVKVTFVNPGTEGFVRFAQIDDIDVELKDLIKGKRVARGSEVWLSYQQSKYVINDITVNGVSKGPRYLGSVLFNVYEDTEVVFDVTVPTEINYVVKVDDFNHVVAYTGNYYDPYNMDTTIELTSNINELTTLSNKAEIHIAPASGYRIASIEDDNGNAYYGDEAGVYTITVTEGMVLTVTTRQIEYDKTLIMYIDTDEEFEYIMVSYPAYRQIQLSPGFNAISYNEVYEPNFLFDFGKEVWAYHNGTLIEPADETTYLVEQSDGDILRVYPDGAPASHRVVFDIDPAVAGEISVMRDLVQPIDPVSPQTELHNTYYAIKSTGARLMVTVTDDGTSHDVTEDDGMYLIAIDSDMTVTVKGASALGSINADMPDDGKVYNLQGMAVSADRLPAGLYIVNGKKVMIRGNE